MSLALKIAAGVALGMFLFVGLSYAFVNWGPPAARGVTVGAIAVRDWYRRHRRAIVLTASIVTGLIVFLGLKFVHWEMERVQTLRRQHAAEQRLLWETRQLSPLERTLKEATVTLPERKKRGGFIYDDEPIGFTPVGHPPWVKVTP
jgi:hypothetical protein